MKRASDGIVLRIGVNLGDVIVEGRDLYGDGVNVAARLEGIAEPGGICISEKVYAEVCKKTDLAFNDMGEQQLKNIAAPVRAYRIDLGAEASLVSSVDAILSRPAVAVLPFDNMSGDPEQEYFADGLTEDIITALSYWRSFPVIARNSTFAYKGQSVDVRKVATELGARYVLEGSVRRGGGRVRITAQLIDAMTGHHVWAEKFDRTLEDIFGLQDEITQRIAAIVVPELERAEQKRLATKRTQNLSAWEYYLRGVSCIHELTKEGNARAREMFLRAIDLDPTYSDAFTGLAVSHHRDRHIGVAEDHEKSQQETMAAARRAVVLDAASSSAHGLLGIAYQQAENYDQAIAEGTTAVSLNPSSALAHVVRGVSLDLAGEPLEGIPHIERALQLSPQDPMNYVYMSLLAFAHLHVRQYEHAVAWARSAIRLRDDYPNAHVCLAACLGHLGRDVEARAELEACRRLNITGQYIKSFPVVRSEHILEGFRKTGWKG